MVNLVDVMTEDEGALGHRSRETIFRYIESQPGVSFATMKRVLGLNESTMRYHLEFLEKKKNIHVKIEKGNRCYFPGGCSKDTARGTLNMDQKRVLDAIKAKPGISKKELCTVTRKDLKAVSDCIEELKSRKLIWKVKSGRMTGYEIITREKLKQEILKLLVAKFLKKEIDLVTYQRLKAEMEEERSKSKPD
jgi:predicted transcriptional regulator